MPMAIDCVSPMLAGGAWQPPHVLSLFADVSSSNHSRLPRRTRRRSIRRPSLCSRLRSIVPVKSWALRTAASSRSRARSLCGAAGAGVPVSTRPTIVAAARRMYACSMALPSRGPALHRVAGRVLAEAEVVGVVRLAGSAPEGGARQLVAEMTRDGKSHVGKVEADLGAGEVGDAGRGSQPDP